MGCICRTHTCTCGVFSEQTPPPAPKPTTQVSITLTGESLTDTVRRAEDAVSLLGAMWITWCETSGNDHDGWYVTVAAKSTR